MTGPNGGDRLERRKARTRAALIAAARDVIARDGSPSVSIQQITDAADVGFGSFYNHFSSKDELFEAAIAEAFEEHGSGSTRSSPASATRPKSSPPRSG